jgi:hypothetical protein
MQTLHLRSRDLRAILLGETPSRWPTPSLRTAATWKGALPLPRLASARSAAKLSPGEFPRSCLTHPRPTLAVGAHPFGGETLPRSLSENAASPSHQRLDRCPTLGAGLTMGSKLREPRVGGATARDTRLVCWSQTAENTPHPAAHQEAGQAVGCSLQTPFSEVLRTPSTGLSFPLRPQRYGARAEWKRTADRAATVGTMVGVSKVVHQRRLRFALSVR